MGGGVRRLECSEFRILLVSFANQQEELPLIDLGSGVCQVLSPCPLSKRLSGALTFLFLSLLEIVRCSHPPLS